MNRPSGYATAASLRQALENRLQRLSEAKGEDLGRLRRQVAFDRLLARIFAEENLSWVLKGGYSLELRMKEARSTRDIDLTLLSSAGLSEAEDLSAKLHTALQRMAGVDIGDFFQFQVGPVTLKIDAAPYGGARFPVDARLAGRTFVKFHKDLVDLTLLVKRLPLDPDLMHTALRATFTRRNSHPLPASMNRQPPGNCHSPHWPQRRNSA